MIVQWIVSMFWNLIKRALLHGTILLLTYFYFAIKQNDNAYVVRKKSYTVSEGSGSEQEIK